MKKTNLRKSNGITLIALVITIIVLLILAGIAISMLSGENGILTKAADAKTKTENATELERVKIVVQSALADGKGTVDLTKLGEKLQEEFKNDSKKPKYEDGKVTLTNGDIYNVTTSGSVEKAITFKKQGTGALAIGDEVEASNGEKFYVIGGDTAGTEISSTTQKVILLAKYNLKKEGTEITLKQDTTGANNTCAFSSKNYWSSETSYPVNLNNYTIPEGATSIVTTAKEYGSKLGATGRLMTKKEADALKTANSKLLYGNKDGKRLNYWEETANQDGSVWVVYGEGSSLDGNDFFYDGDNFGLRPVIEVLASSIN